MKKSLFSLLLLLPILLSGADIYLAGDSTMQGYDKSIYPITGWGAKLQPLCKPGVTVHNLGRSGESSRSYYTHEYYGLLLNAVKPGDYVFIQFGHNDAHRDKRNTDPDTTYQEYLKKYIADVRARKCIPVLLTQNVICRFKNGKVYNSEIEQRFIEATRKVAREMNVELIDHNAWSLEHVSALGEEKAKTLYMFLKKGEYPAYPEGRNDNSHYHERGAVFFAKGAVEQAKADKLKVARLFK